MLFGCSLSPDIIANMNFEHVPVFRLIWPNLPLSLFAFGFRGSYASMPSAMFAGSAWMATLIC